MKLLDLFYDAWQFRSRTILKFVRQDDFHQESIALTAEE